jgi:predicted ferric reductase
VRSRDDDPFVARLEALTRALPNVRLHVLSSAQGERLDARRLAAAAPGSAPPAVWFCGPHGLLDALRRELAAAGLSGAHIHHEAFDMR